MKAIIPLYSFFTTLKNQSEFSLGLEEYFSLIEVLSMDRSYYKDAQSLYNLCRLLWLKPGQSELLFLDIYKQIVNDIGNIENNTVEKDKGGEAKDIKDKEKPKDTNAAEENKNNKENESYQREISTQDDFYIYIADKVREQFLGFKSEDEITAPYHIHLVDEYSILGKLQLKQAWRHLKKNTKRKISDEVNVDLSIDLLARDGMLTEPVFSKANQNQIKLFVLLDNGTSMIPFKGLTRAILETATEGAGIENHIYYFKNLPDFNKKLEDYILYTSPANSYYTKLSKEISHSAIKQNDLLFLIISDAGAAKGNLDLSRVVQTVGFLKHLKRSSLKIAWMNPVPEDRWNHSPASMIQNYVPMFEANSTGIKNAIRIFLGKLIAPVLIHY